MTTYFKVLSAERTDSYPCLVLFTDRRRVLFDCGEGTQRLCIEHRVRLSKVDTICFTRASPQTVGGLPGFCLTAADVGKRSLQVLGPSLLPHFWRSTQHFMCPQLNIKFESRSEYTQTSTSFVDDVEIDKVNIYNNSVADCQTDNDACCFICKTPVIPGKFDLKKAVSLGVPKGPLFGQLKSGNSITLADDVTVIMPSDVLGPSEPASYAMVICKVEAEDEKMLDLIINNTELNRFAGSCTSTSVEVSCMFHFSSISVMNMPRYRLWMNSFSASCRHVCLGRGAEGGAVANVSAESSYVSSTAYSNKLHYLAPELFAFIPEIPRTETVQVELDSSNVHGELALQYVLLPSKKRGFNMLDSCGRSGDENPVEEGDKGLNKRTTSLRTQSLADFGSKISCNDEIVGMQENAGKFKEFCRQIGKGTIKGSVDIGVQQLINAEENRIWFLGTGSAIPSKYRNVSGILLELNHCKCRNVLYGKSNPFMLLDAGEGTWQQMMRIGIHSFSRRSSGDDAGVGGGVDSHVAVEEEVGLSLSLGLKCIWISHPHADHHLGIIRILTERRHHILKHLRLTATPSIKPIVVIAPPSVLAFLRDYCVALTEPPNLIPLRRTFIGVSNRQLDRFDSCVYGDVYWTNVKGDQVAATDCTSSEVEVETSGGETDLEIRRKLFFQNMREQERIDIIDATSSTPAVKSSNHSSRDFYMQVPQWFTPDMVADMTQAKHILRDEMRLESVDNVRVHHCAYSYGVAVVAMSENDVKSSGSDYVNACNKSDDKNVSQWKVVYSGDTRPSSRLVDCGLDATILIHEATFDDSMVADAVAKNHSTISEAIQIGERMKACRTILTHFSQRYATMPPMPNYEGNEITSGVAANVSSSQLSDISAGSMSSMTSLTVSDTKQQLDFVKLVNKRRIVPAFDFMNISFGDLVWAPVMTELFSCVFPPLEDDSEDVDNAPAANGDMIMTITKKGKRIYTPKAATEGSAQHTKKKQLTSKEEKLLSPSSKATLLVPLLQISADESAKIAKISADMASSSVDQGNGDLGMTEEMRAVGAGCQKEGVSAYFRTTGSSTGRNYVNTAGVYCMQSSSSSLTHASTTRTNTSE